jgi:signal transduction histidine kinase
MSGCARKALRNPACLSEISALRFWRVWESRDTVLIWAQCLEADSRETNELLRIERQLTLHLLQLLGTERRLCRSARRRRRGGGLNVIRQLEMERQRLGRELHTGVAQMLAAIRLQLEVIAIELPAPPENVAHALSSISALAAETLDQVRGISRRLHPPEWQRLTLESALRQLWELSGIPQRFEASLQIRDLPEEPHLEVKVLIYRGLQESLNNLVRHSLATRVDVMLEKCDGQLVLIVRDDGVGFDAERLFSAPATVAAGIGLRSIREATQALGGKFEVESGLQGTKLIISVAPFPVES